MFLKKISSIVPLFLLAVTVAAFFIPFAFTNTVPYAGDYSGSDLFELNIPFRMLAANAWKTGEVPLWTPLLAHGFPLLAEGQAGIFYPPNIAFIFFSWPWALVISVAINFFIAGAFTYLLVRSFSLSRGAAFIAAISFAFSGAFVFRFKHTNLVNAAAWLPLALYCVEYAYRQRRVVFPALFLGTTLSIQFFAGHPQITYITVLTCGIYSIARWYWQGEKGKSLQLVLRNVLFFWIIAGVIALCASAVQLLPTLELANHSDRGQWAQYQESVKLFFSPAELLTLFNPYIYGNPANNTYRGFDLGFPGGFWENTIYLGILPLLLAIFGAIRRRKDVVIKILLVVIALSIFFIFAKFNPFFPWVWLLLPGVRVFRFFQRFTIVLTLLLSIFAAIGYDELATMASRLPKKFLTAFTRVAGVCIVSLIIVIDLFWVSWQYIGGMSKEYYDIPTSAQYLLKDSDKFRIASMLYQASWHQAYRLNDGWSGTTHLFMDQRSVLQPNASAIWGLESFNDRGWDEGGQLDGHLSSLLKAHKEHWVFDGRKLIMEPSAVRVLGMQNVKYLTSFYELEGEGLVLERELPQVLMPPVKIYRNEYVLPRAFAVASSTSVLTDADAITTLFDIAAFLNETMVVQGPTVSSGKINATTTIETVGNNEIVLRAELSDASYVFVSNLYYPGWHATIDGRSAEIVRANVAFMAVFVPSGNHEVVFTYMPWSFICGAIVSIMTWLLIIIAAGWYYIGRKILYGRRNDF